MGEASDEDIKALIKRFAIPEDQIETQWPDTRYIHGVGFSPFLIDTATSTHERAEFEPVVQLFGDMWRSGEVAVLCGEPGVGKSILATQIAETIARGTGGRKRQTVLYFDFEHTDRHFTERYSCRPVPSSQHRLTYQFSKRFQRATIVLAKPVFKDYNDLNHDILYWLREEIHRREHSIFVIDNVSYLTGKMSIVRVVKNLKLWAREARASVLIIAHTRNKRRPSPVTMSDLSSGRTLAELADNLFAIAPSTLSPDLRYVKSLKPRSTAALGDVLTFRLSRMLSPEFSYEPKPTQPALAEDNSDHEPPAGTLADQPLAPVSPHTPGTEPFPFLGFRFAGTSDEQTHLRDYAKEALLATRRPTEPKRVRPRSARTQLTEAILNGEFNRYLNGE